jgi:nicotinamide riboside kinase
MIHIAIAGPESSGKTTLCEALAAHFPDSKLISEYAREYLELHHPDGNYSIDDVRSMFTEQLSRWLESLESDTQFVIWDTDPTVYKIWVNEVYKEDWKEIKIAVDEMHPDILFLCKPDIPWEYDPLRQNPNDRDRLFEIFKVEYRKSNSDYVLILGNHEQRKMIALEAIEDFIANG